MSNNNQSLVKHQVESPELRQWATKTITAKGGKKADALAPLLQAAYLLWERLDQGMDIQQLEAYIRTVMIKSWKKQVTPEMALATSPSYTAGSYEVDDQTVELERTREKQAKIAKIASWNEVIVQAEKLRRQRIIGGVLLLSAVLIIALVYFFIVAPTPATQQFLERFF